MLNEGDKSYAPKYGEAFTRISTPRPATKVRHATQVLVSYQPIVDEAGEVIGVSIAVADVTELQPANQLGIKSATQLGDKPK
jgi:hypothetical protein